MAALQLARTLLGPEGVVISSIPNFRQFLNLWEVIVKGQWRYQDSGILDRTHLRFFTHKSMLDLFADSGFKVDKIEGVNAYPGGTPRKWFCFHFINCLTFDAIEDMKYLQFAVVARPNK